MCDLESATEKQVRMAHSFTKRVLLLACAILGSGALLLTVAAQLPARGDQYVMYAVYCWFFSCVASVFFVMRGVKCYQCNQPIARYVPGTHCKSCGGALWGNSQHTASINSNDERGGDDDPWLQ